MKEQVVTRASDPAGAVAGGPSRRERKKREQRRRIFDAAAELFNEKGFESTTVEEIAERADVAKATVFNYFPRKESFLFALAERMVERLWAELGPPGEWRGSARSQLRRLFLKLAEQAERNRELSSLILFENMRNLCLKSEEEPAVRGLEEAIREVIRQARARGEFRDDADPELAAELLQSTFFTTVVSWLSAQGSERRLSLEFSRKLDMVFYGLAAQGTRPEEASE